MNQENLQGQKFALLIGVSECAAGFGRLRCPLNSIQEVRTVLVDPNIGDFEPDNIVSLENPNVSEMQSAIGEFFSKCSYRDLVVFYFTGHGVKDERGDFFFTTCETRKDESGFLNRGTAVAARFVRNEMMNCYSRRQVAILDCCFSGAFPDGTMAMDDQTVDLERQLGGEGRAILTAATSTDYALEQGGEYLSAYTRYLVEGLRTGAAAPDDQELIQVGHLHNYIRSKLKTAAAAMSPQIYAAREGHEIVLAKTSIDNELQFRKLLESYYLEFDGQISPIRRRTIKKYRESWGIEKKRAEDIEFEVAQPYRERGENLKEYEEVYREAIDFEDPLSPRTEKELRDYQHTLKLRDQDVQPIEDRLRRERRNQGSGNSLFAIFLEKIASIPRLNKRSLSFAAVGTAALAVGLLGWQLLPDKNIIRVLTETPPTEPPSQVSGNTDRVVSSGETILIESEEVGEANQNFREAKSKGVIAFSDGDYEGAFNYFEQAIDYYPNSPETLIYLNNARAEISGGFSPSGENYTIAVVVPITGDLPAAQAMLRGVAQAQHAVNNDGGIDGVLLKVVIVDDFGDAKRAPEIAERIGEMSEVLGVVGHYYSNVTLAAEEIYKEQALPIISLSSSVEIPDRNNEYIFRTSPSDEVTGRSLAAYMVNELDKTRVVIFHSDSSYSESLAGQFANAVLMERGDVVVRRFNWSLSDFDSQQAFEFAIEEDVQVLMFIPASVSEIEEKVLPIAQLNFESGLPFDLMGGDVAYSQEILTEEFEGMVVGAFWHVDANEDSDFVVKSNNLWGAQINWKTAMAYDATRAWIEALRRSDSAPTRNKLQQIISSQNFTASGASSSVTFTQRGERDIPVELVEVRSSTNGYRFEPVSSGN